jgi:hypothetical protein
LTDVVHASRYRPARWRLPPDILDWVGERHYPTAADFAREAKRYGISRRMPGVPKAIVPPYSRAFFAHARCEWPAEERVGPGVFGYYVINQVQYVLPEGYEQVPPPLRRDGVVGVRVHRVETEKEI